MTQPDAGGWPTIEVGNTALTEQITGELREIVVESDGNGPDACRIVFTDPARDMAARGQFGVGKPLTVAATAARGSGTGKVFDGLVCSIAFTFDDRGAFTTITCYDRTYGLYNGRHTKVYRDRTDSDVVRDIAKEVGLTAGVIENTTVVHKHLPQMNETYWAFLTERARENGFVLLATGDTGDELHFHKPVEAADAPDPGDLESVDPLQLVPGNNLDRVSVRVAPPVKEVEVRSWDPVTKQPFSAVAPVATTTAQLPDTPEALAAAFGETRYVVADLPLASQAACEAAAASAAAWMADVAVHAEGMGPGDPRIKAGVAVSLGMIPFAGKVTVSWARHVWGRRGYHTEWVASGGHDRSSVLGLVTGAGGAARSRMNGLVTGIVTNVSDEEHRGRVKLKFPWLSDDYETDWARVVQFGAGKDTGWVLPPKVNDEVLVGFEHGDGRVPYVLGGLYNGVDTPPATWGPLIDDQDTGTVNVYGFRTPAGHEFVFTDKAGEEKIELRTKEQKVAFTLDAKTGALQIDAKGDVTVNAEGNATITTKKDLSVTATGKATITAKGLKLDGGTGEVVVKGSKIKLN